MSASAEPAPLGPADWDPLHEQVGPGGAWTRVNISEAIPGVPTPLTWSFWFPAQELGILGAWHDLGIVPASEVRIAGAPEERLGAIFYGRPAANVDLMRRMADRIPGSSGDALEQQLLGSRRRPSAAGRPSRARHPVIAVRLPYTVWRLPGRLRRLRAEVEPWWRNATDPEAPGDEEALGRELRACHAAFLRVMRPHAAASNLAQLCFEQVRRLAEEAGRPGLEAALVAGYGGMEETGEVRLLWEVAQGRRPLRAFVEAFGFHTPSEGELASRSWREDDSPLRVAVKAMRERGGEGPSETEKHQTGRREQAERELFSLLAPRRRVVARVVLAAARRYVPQREHGKATFLRVLDLARRAARARGRLWFERGLLADPEDVFHLCLDELTAPEPPADAAARIRLRRRRRAAYQALELPDSWVGMPRPRRIAAVRPDPSARYHIEALGVSPGVVEGRVRVIDDLGAESHFEAGEVLVCPRTDPSWASLLWLAGAAVIDVGGPLSHGAIVARELGIPCVINAGDASRRLRTGDRVRVDGAAGTVERIAPGAGSR